MTNISKTGGCLIGQCLGDALGYPVEGFPPEECRDYLHSFVKELWFAGSKDGMFGFGQYTDDSQLARELLDSLVFCNGFDPENYSMRIVNLFSSNRVVGRGIACNDAVSRLAAGVDWEKAGCLPPAAGNGTAMRAAPVGMIYNDRPTEMIDIARKQGWITHRDLRCDAGSIAIAGAVALAIRDRVEPLEFTNQLSEWVSVADKGTAEYIKQLPDILRQPPEEAVNWASAAGKEPDRIDDWPGISPFVTSSVLWSLYCFLKTPDDYFQSIWHSIACGGDVDTTAAMTGAISGAYVGIEALPKHTTCHLHDHGEWRLEQLIELCEQIDECDW